jgi:integrase
VAKKRGNGEGGITRHKKSGLYMARYTVQTPTGPKRKTIYGKEREEVAEKLIEALSNRNKGLIFEGEDQTLSAYLDRWLNGSVKGSVKPSTYESYERMIRNHIKPALGNRKLKNLAPDHVQYFYQHKLDAGLAPGTVRLAHGILHKALEQAVKWEWSLVTSARPRLPRSRTQRRYTPWTPSRQSASWRPLGGTASRPCTYSPSRRA